MGKRYALLIGISEYPKNSGFRKLHCPIEDVKKFGKILKDPEMGFFDDVKILANCTAKQAKIELSDLIDKTRPDDLILFYFSGHGKMGHDDELHFATIDTEFARPHIVSLSADFVRNEFDNARARQQLIILDCCFSGAFFHGFKGGEEVKAVTKETFSPTEGRGRYILTASTQSQTAGENTQLDIESDYSVFTHYLIEGIEQGKADLIGEPPNGTITPEELGKYVKEEVRKSVTRQEPTLHIFNPSGEVTISRNPRYADWENDEKKKVVRNKTIEGINKLLESGSTYQVDLGIRQLKEAVDDDDKELASWAKSEIQRLQKEYGKYIDLFQTGEYWNKDPEINKFKEFFKKNKKTILRITYLILGIILLIAILWGVTLLVKDWKEKRNEIVSEKITPTMTITRSSTATQPIFTKTSTATITQAITISPSITLTATNEDTETLFRKTDDMEMLLIPAGTFLMGLSDLQMDTILKQEWCSDCTEKMLEDERPAHYVTLDAYWIDKYEVTNSQYAQCVDAGVCTTLDSNSSYLHTYYFNGAEYANYPVINVDWNQATTYCQWVGGSLPTEAQWEKAARGTDGRTFPWGEAQPSCAITNYAYTSINYCHGDTTRIGSYRTGSSPYGVMDMSGNVWEWVSDWYMDDYYSVSPEENPTGPEGRLEHVIRGGTWNSRPFYLRTTNRGRKAASKPDNYIGFRCVMPVIEE